MDSDSRDELKERLLTLLAECGAELSGAFDRFDAQEAELERLQCLRTEEEQQLQALTEKAEGQENLIEVLRAEAEETHSLAETVRERDQEVERLRSELESKQELVTALRRDKSGNEELQAKLHERDDELTQLREQLAAAEDRASQLESERDELSADAASEAAEEWAETSALRTELEARKALIRSLRADAERVDRLQQEIESKRDIIVELEALIDQHVETIAGLRRNGDRWRRKYQMLRGGGTETSAPAAAAPETDFDVIGMIEEAAGGEHGNTVAIDVKVPLSEARKRAAGHPQQRLASREISPIRGLERADRALRRQVQVTDVHALAPADTEADRSQ